MRVQDGISDGFAFFFYLFKLSASTAVVAMIYVEGLGAVPTWLGFSRGPSLTVTLRARFSLHCRLFLLSRKLSQQIESFEYFLLSVL